MSVPGATSTSIGQYINLPWHGATASLRVQRAFGRDWPIDVEGQIVARVRAPSADRPWSEIALPDTSPAIVVALSWRSNSLIAEHVFVDGVSLHEGLSLAEVQRREPVVPDRFARGAGQFGVLARPPVAIAAGVGLGAVAAAASLPAPLPVTLMFFTIFFGIAAGWAFAFGLFTRWMGRRTSPSPVARALVVMACGFGLPILIVGLLAAVAH